MNNYSEADLDWLRANYATLGARRCAEHLGRSRQAAYVVAMGAEMRMDNDTQGGFMVPTTLRSTILQVKPQDVLVRPRAQVLDDGSDAGMTMPALDQSGSNPANMFGGVEVQWIGEGEEKPETDANPKLQWKDVPQQIDLLDKSLTEKTAALDQQTAAVDALGAETARLQAENAEQAKKIAALNRKRDALIAKLNDDALDPGDRADCWAQVRAAEDALNLLYREGY